MTNDLKRFFSIFRRKERFLIVEIFQEFIRGTFFKVSFDQRKIEVMKAVKISHHFKVTADIIGLVKKVLRKFGKTRRYKIVISLDPLFGTTIHATVVLVRDKPGTPIDESDLDNRVAQGIWRLFDRERGRAARKMKAGDLEVLLTDVRVKKIKLDGHKVMNPLGFKAKTFEIQFIQTFSPRNFAVELRKTIPAEQLLLTAESGVFETDILTRIGKARNFFLINIFRDHSQVNFSDGSTIAHLETLNWGGNNFLKAISKSFSIEEETAREIFELFLIRQASSTVLRKIYKLLLEEFLAFVENLRKSITKYRPEVIYLSSFFDLPEFIFAQSSRNPAGGRVKFLPAGEHFISSNLGFDLKYNSPAENPFSSFAALLGFYFLPQDDNINKIAKRHARWLIS